MMGWELASVSVQALFGWDKGTAYRVRGIWVRDAFESFVCYELRSPSVVVVHVCYALKSVCRLLHGFCQLEAV